VFGLRRRFGVKTRVTDEEGKVGLNLTWGVLAVFLAAVSNVDVEPGGVRRVVTKRSIYV
jgi:hypothetical protein